MHIKLKILNELFADGGMYDKIIDSWFLEKIQ